jgi:hypothetical protein
MKKIIFALALAFTSATFAQTLNTLTDKEKKDGWKLLFDGKSVSGWHNYRSKTLNPQWKAVDGAFVLTEKGGGDVVSDDEFENFELSIDWKIADCGNSGIFYNVVEDTASWAFAVYASGPEMQVLDDKCHPDNKLESHRAGALYDQLPLMKPAVKPAGEWNKAILKIKNGKAEHWLNGIKVVEYTLWTPEWDALVAKSKFNGWKGYGKFKKGHFALQDHGDMVSFRNIKVRQL